MGRNNSASSAKSRGQCKAGHNLTMRANGNSTKNARMPMCTYGRACTRKGCIYRHPPKATSTEVDSTIPICKPYLAAACLYGKQCNNRHPPNAEVEKIVAKYLKTECRFGMDCQSSICLYKHTPPPEPEPEPAPALELEPDGSGAVSADAGPDPRLARVRALLKARAQSIDAAAAASSSSGGDGDGSGGRTGPDGPGLQPQQFQHRLPGGPHSPPPPHGTAPSQQQQQLGHSLAHPSAGYRPRFCPPDPGNPRSVSATMPGAMFGYGSTAVSTAVPVPAGGPALAPGAGHGALTALADDVDGGLSAAFGGQSLGGGDPIVAPRSRLGPGAFSASVVTGVGTAAPAAVSSMAAATTTLSVGAIEFVPSWG